MPDIGYNDLSNEWFVDGTSYDVCIDMLEYCYITYQKSYTRYDSYTSFCSSDSFFCDNLANVDGIYATLGLYIPLIVVNCIILGRAEAFACGHGPLESLFDGAGMGLGFSIALTLLGAVREFLGAGSVFGMVLLPETSNMLLFILPPGAFITLGYLIAIVNRFKRA